MRSKLFRILFVLIFILSGCQRHNNEKNNINKSANRIFAKFDSCILSSRVSDPELALEYANEAQKKSEETGTIDAKIYSLLLKGNAYSLSDKDSSYYCYSRALAISDSFGINLYNHKLLYNIGMLYAEVSDMKNALKLLDSARYFAVNQSDDYLYAVICNSTGTIYRDLYDTIHSKLMFETAFSIAKKKSYYDLIGSALANLASLESNPDRAFTQLRKAAAYSVKSGRSNEETAMILTNLSTLYNSQPDSGIYYNNLALSHISSKASPKVFVSIYNNLAYDYLFKGDTRTAISCLTDYAFPVAIKLGNSDLLSNLFDSYADIYKNMKDFNKAYNYEKKSNAALQNFYYQQGSAQVRLLAAMLDEKRREAQINESKLIIANVRNSRNFLFLGSILGLIVFSVILFYFIQQKRIQLNEQQIDSAKKIMEAEENERTKLGREFHDIAGQKFSQMIAYYQGADYSERQLRETSLKMITELRETVRTLTHKMNPDWILNFSLEESLAGLINDLQKVVPVVVESHIDNQIPQVSNEVKIQVFRIMQELIANYLKHAFESKVIFHLQNENKFLILKYIDEGPGFDPKEKISIGIGISNIYQRVRFLNGEIELESRPRFGTFYQIKIPLK